MHAARGVALWHFLMDDAAAGRHPLDVARAERALIAEAVAVGDRAGQDVGDRLDAAMGMPREAAQVVLRTVVPEVVEEQERIEVLGVAEPEDALQLDAGTFDGGRGRDVSLNGSDRHGPSLFWRPSRCASLDYNPVGHALAGEPRGRGVWNDHRPKPLIPTPPISIDCRRSISCG